MCTISLGQKSLLFSPFRFLPKKHFILIVYILEFFPCLWYFKISLYCVQKRTFPSLFFLRPSMGHFNLRTLIFLKGVYFFRLFPPLHFSLFLRFLLPGFYFYPPNYIAFILCVWVGVVVLVLSSFLGISLIYPLIILFLSCIRCAIYPNYCVLYFGYYSFSILKISTCFFLMCFVSNY